LLPAIRSLITVLYFKHAHLFIGDIVGSPGRLIVQERLADLVERRQIDLVIANGEIPPPASASLRKSPKSCWASALKC
jgi:hypothetical protein